MAGTRLLVFVTYLIPLIFITPIAYQLVRVHRSYLPFDKINGLSSSFPGKFNIPLHFVTTMSFEPKLAGLDPLFEVNATVSRISTLPKGESMEELDDILLQKVKTDSYTFFLGCFDPTFSKQWMIGKYRHGWRNICEEKDIEQAVQELNVVLPRYLFPSPSTVNAETSISLAYRLTFSLLNENPLEHRAAWNFSAIANQYLGGFLGKMSQLANFTIESQVLQFAKLSSEIDTSNNLRCVSQESLQQFMSANDWISTTVLEDREQNLNFFAFVSVPTQFPMVIYKDQCKQANSVTAFEIPGWGGVSVHNRPASAVGMVSVDEIQDTMRYFIAHCRSLLGLSPVGVQGHVVAFLASPKYGITEWELDVLIRSWLYRHLSSTVQTLKSIAKLVNDMPHMSVLARIQQNVEASLELLEKANHHAFEEFNYTLALKHAREATALADKAYYDPTMVPQLYFPEEHIYAVYLPLLAPLFLPLLPGLKREYQRYKQLSKV